MKIRNLWPKKAFQHWPEPTRVKHLSGIGPESYLLVSAQILFNQYQSRKWFFRISPKYAILVSAQNSFFRYRPRKRSFIIGPRFIPSGLAQCESLLMNFFKKCFLVSAHKVVFFLYWSSKRTCIIGLAINDIFPSALNELFLYWPRKGPFSIALRRALLVSAQRVFFPYWPLQVHFYYRPKICSFSQALE
jgi:hypothetical protein